ncbi:MAG: hypothetical protein UT01_C0058G0007 [Candidatus Daviesbacteria bacterium GW2011_GWA1_38_7]|nr:MAG: hypothetical protein UT01_C0058G0007 [Candidatus Daviesbacteria bacterium GW2011_GWA1_38_7]OGE23428.1 MAG: hypothetical protein A2688_02305 [Candidatus Daviesbacteria bacterium RIFCSPHIGHO2_01_FULL_38_8]
MAEIKEYKDYKIAVLGGGHGPRNIERALNRRTRLLISLVGGTQDNGGHTEKLSRELHIPGIGDIPTRMSNHFLDPYLQDTFDYRWEGEMSFKGERPITSTLASFVYRERSLSEGVKRFESMYASYRGHTIPVTEHKMDLKIDYENGDSKVGEKHVDGHTLSDPPIKKIELLPSPSITTMADIITANPETIEALETSDANILAPGTVRGSTEPILHIPGIVEAFNKGPHKFVFVNSFNHPETYGWKASDHLKLFNEHGLDIDEAVVVKMEHPIPPQYFTEGLQAVYPDIDECARYAKRIHWLPITHLEEYKDGRQIVKHDGEIAGDLIYSILDASRTIHARMNGSAKKLLAYA